jgi:cell wall-associated NlpC family hydrolase
MRRLPLTPRGALIALALALAGCASSTSSTGPPGPAAFPGARAPSAAPSRTAAVVDTALGLQGTPYRLGGDDPQRGFDCSGFVRYVLAQHGIEIPRTAAEQFRVGTPMDREQVRPGDLVFFTTIAPGPSHVGLALPTPGTFIHAPANGGVVRVERWDTPYWRARWLGARRIAR